MSNGTRLKSDDKILIQCCHVWDNESTVTVYGNYKFTNKSCINDK